jgi:hypothetical protein
MGSSLEFVFLLWKTKEKALIFVLWKTKGKIDLRGRYRGLVRVKVHLAL